MGATVMAVEATATVDAATAVATTARGLLMPMLSPVTAMAAMVVMVDAAMAVATTARGRLRPSPATAMVATGVDAATAGATTARGLLMPRLMLVSSSLAPLVPLLPP